MPEAHCVWQTEVSVPRESSTSNATRNTKSLVLRGNPTKQGADDSGEWAILDSMPSECHGRNVNSLESGTESGAVGARDGGLKRLAELWPRLSEPDRVALLDHAEHFVALRGGGEAVLNAVTASARCHAGSGE